MCHWVLHVWQCGESFFTKYSQCSFDRAVHDPGRLLNPLHPSIRPIGVVVDNETCPPPSSSDSSWRKESSSTSPATPTLPLLPTVDLSSPRNRTHTLLHQQPPAMALEEVGKASRFGDSTLGEKSKCRVFEVVLQRKEATICPFCARSPKRARLPPHARGCFSPS